MTVHGVDAIYENGVLRPLEPLALAESQRVKLTIFEAAGGRSQRDMSIVERARAEAAAAGVPPTIEEVRDALSVIPGSLSEDVSADRGEY